MGFIKYRLLCPIMSHPLLFLFLIFRVHLWKCWLLLIKELVERFLQ